MNTTVAFIAQVTAILMGFFTRVVFTRTLSEGYVGINGLFTDILNILSLSELGVGTAITYALYGPIARNDIKKQQILMRMFRTFYRMTAGFVLVAGLCLIPFLDILMKDRPDVDHLIVIYILYLTNSVVSYLLIYKKTLVDAHQMNYITVMYHNGFLVLQDICQIVVLLLHSEKYPFFHSAEVYPYKAPSSKEKVCPLFRTYKYFHLSYTQPQQ
jgi:O-antigen/teichoic acid export membrane protein